MAIDTAEVHERVFVVMRVDSASGRDRAPEDYLALLKAFRSQPEAETEVERLNHYNREVGSTYCWKATMLRARPVGVGLRSAPPVA